MTATKSASSPPFLATSANKVIDDLSLRSSGKPPISVFALTAPDRTTNCAH
nr:hypothetical protein [Mycolicibacterium gadium]